MKRVTVIVRVNGHTVELGQGVLSGDESRAWLELEPGRTRNVLRQLTPSEGLPPPPPRTLQRPTPARALPRPSRAFQGRTTERCVADLEWLAERSQRGLADPSKSRWHATLRQQLASILEELNRLQSR
ncbi:MAG: hypothetical protein JNM17_09035 [Archangium sp.]|nr:hypothetical protein [Archangium sp.]